MYVKRETALNKCKNKVPKLLLSEIKVVFSLIRPGNRLRSGHFLKTCWVIWEITLCWVKLPNSGDPLKLLIPNYDRKVISG